MNLNTARSTVASFLAWTLVAYISAVIGMCIYDPMHGRVPAPIQWTVVMTMFWQPIVVGGVAATALTEFGILGSSET